MTDDRRAEDVAAALEALPRDLRRDPFGYDLSHADLLGWAHFMVGWVDGAGDADDLAEALADENIADIHGAETKKVGAGYGELAEDEHFSWWVKAMEALQ